MRCAADTRGPGYCLVRIGLEPTDKLRQVRNGQILFDRNDLRIECNQRNRLKIPHDIVLERIGRAIEDVGRDGAQNGRMPVSVRARDLARTDASRCTWNVLDDYRLPQS